jgi:hypothetical protein
MKVRLPVAVPTEAITHISVEVDYSKGGMNYASGATERRGIYCYVRPVALRDGFERWVMFSGGKSLLEELPRASAKKLQKWEAAVYAQLTLKCGDVWDVIQRVCRGCQVEILEVRENVAAQLT